MSYWRIIHYPLTIVFIILTFAHVLSIVYYGGGMPEGDALKGIKVPTMGSYGGEDQGIPKEKVDALRDALTAAGTPNDIKLYDGAKHSFFNSGPAHHEGASADSWERSKEWFGKYVAS